MGTWTHTLHTHIHTQNCDAEIQFNSLHVLLLSQPSHPMLTMSITVSKAGLSLAKLTNNQLAGKGSCLREEWPHIFHAVDCVPGQLKLILFKSPKGSNTKKENFFFLIRWFTHSTSISQYMYPLHAGPGVKAGCVVVSRNGHISRCHRA